jgi:adenosylmethionine-8-amino-7-oxononanoate aminotransferase
LLEPVRSHPRVRHFRHLGMIWAFDVAGAHSGFARRFAQSALEQGVLLRPIGNTVYCMPPYVVGEEEMRRVVAAMLHGLDETAYSSRDAAAGAGSARLP